MNQITETITLKHGMEIDLHDGWRKLVQRQFDGNPARGFSELVQNGFDSYVGRDTPWQEKRLDIQTTATSITITDYGEGMARERLRLLVTIGGTDKANDSSKIGQFGIGFCAMFNPDLGTEKVTAHTMCEGHAVELIFIVHEPGKIPEINTRILDEEFQFSTRITAEFDNSKSARDCLKYAQTSLETFPCAVKINGRTYKSIWEKARQDGREIFTSGSCMGFIESSGFSRPQVCLLRRYERITTLGIASLMTGGHGRKYDLRDWARKETPFVETVDITINCNNLNVPISRDGFYLDSAYHAMIRVVNEQLMYALEKELEKSNDEGLILANQYVFKNKLKNYLSKIAEAEDTSDVPAVVKKLAEAPVYKLNGKSGLYSLVDIKKMRSIELPVFYSPQKRNCRWLGGAFKRDFIVLTPSINNRNRSYMAPIFYDDLFKTIFSDVVNLDEIASDHEKIAELVEREIIDKGALSPDVKIIGARQLSKKEGLFLEKVDAVLSHEAVKKAVAKNLNIQVSEVHCAFFELQNTGGVIATGFFDEHGNPLENKKKLYSNLKTDQKSGSAHARPLLLGLQRDNVYIDSLLNTKDEDIVYYMIMYLTHELAMCQKLLVPYSPYFHVVKSRLARDMRKALIEQLLTRQGVEELEKVE